MQPGSWEEAQKAFELLWKMFPPATIHAVTMMGEPADGGGHPTHPPEEYDADGFLKEIPEEHFADPVADPWNARRTGSPAAPARRWRSTLNAWAGTRRSGTRSRSLLPRRGDFPHAPSVA